MVTAWDTAGDAGTFVAGMRSWLGDRPTGAAASAADPRTTVALFASDGATFDALEAALR
jgi:hypothetical protein